MAMNSILGLFANSPFKPIQKHSEKVTECCGFLIDFFEATFNGDWEKAALLHQQIGEAERDADSLKRDIRLKLPRGLFMPIARTDLLELVTQQDKLANYTKDISGRMMGRRCAFPQHLKTEVMAYVCRSLDASKQANRVITEMDNLLETGFKGREFDLVSQMINQLDAIEDDTDHLQVELRVKLRAVEEQYNPIDVMFLYKTLEWIGVVADQAQRVGSRIELMLARA